MAIRTFHEAVGVMDVCFGWFDVRLMPLLPQGDGCGFRPFDRDLLERPHHSEVPSQRDCELALGDAWIRVGGDAEHGVAQLGEVSDLQCPPRTDFLRLDDVEVLIG